eukprot:31475-Pelagococcus_subviridis.AAC.6
MVYIDDGVSLVAVADRGGGGGGWPVATGASRRAGEERRRRRPRGGWMGRDDARARGAIARARGRGSSTPPRVFFLSFARTAASAPNERRTHHVCLHY